MRHSFFVLAASVCVLVVAACGSTSGGKVAGGTGAEISPAGSIAFVSIDVDQATREWQKLAGLLDRVTGLSGLGRLAGGACLRSIPSALGKTVGVAVLSAKGGSRAGVVLMTRPANAPAAKLALAHGVGAECVREIRARVRPAGSIGVKSARKSPQLALTHATRESDGWLLISDSSATLDRFESDAKRGALAGSHAFRAAFATLPEKALVRAYFRGAAVSGVTADLGGIASRLPAAKTKPDWVALAARTTATGLSLDGTVSAVEAENAPNSLIGEAPAGSRLALGFTGSSYGFDQALEKLASDAKTGRELAQFENFLGLGPDAASALARGEIALFDGTLGGGAVAVDPRTGKITGQAGLGLELRGAGAAETARKIEKGLPALASFLKGSTRRISLNGVSAQELTLGALRFFIAGVDGKMLLSADETVIGRGPKLSSNRVFLAAKSALRLPGKNAGVLFVRLDRASDRDREALLGYLDAAGGTLRIHGVLVIG